MAMQKIAVLDSKVELSEMVPVEHGHVRQRTGERTGQVEILIDLGHVGEYVRRALASKSGKCKQARGALMFRVVKDSVRETKFRMVKDRGA